MLTTTLKPLEAIVPPECLPPLQKLRIHTLLELLHYYPRTHVTYHWSTIPEIKPGDQVIITGTIEQHRILTPKNGRLTVQSWVVTDRAENAIRVMQFHHGSDYRSQQWRVEQHQFYRAGRSVIVMGKVKQDDYTRALTIEATEVKVADLAGKRSSIKDDLIQPVYALTKGLDAETLRDSITVALDCVRLHDPLPKKLRQHYHLMELSQAIAQIHFPSNPQTLAAARHRLVFDEFFYLQLRLLKRRAALKQVQREALSLPTTLLKQFYTVLPFQLTGAQQRVIGEILDDLAKAHPMNRLVQGDVGSGKTVVAVAAILATIQAGYQAALMAPTEVLAEQHFHKIAQWFESLQLPVALLTGSTPTAQRRTIHANLRSRQLPLVIGTHALIQKTVQFERLGLVVIDEQHRFGVQQRLKLQQKGHYPHVLSMTATPIPRTLALTLHGDLDVSQLDEMPPGRKPVLTRVLTENQRSNVTRMMERNLALGRQVYVILPLVEQSDTSDLQSAIAAHQTYQQQFSPYRVGLLHGRMSAAEKQSAIAQFHDHQTHILVSTTVIEVGVDVPNATVIVIEHAERFGLSQLHQLRGRVGRGNAQSYCLLVNTSTSDDAKERLKVLEQTQDGFVLAEVDMQLRGTGDVLGTAQAGLPKFALADLVKDADVLEQARKAAQLVVQRGDRLQCWTDLMAEMTRRDRHKLDNRTALN
ncbi:MAG: ATP-dependent DNA helicase RecG [Leptolyngbyaceae cyanobacterium bins.302]|nr:ATP-dependent DNA helicase RecG [Leptolyngbyaceae cyanobacterium bins.302]